MPKKTLSVVAAINRIMAAENDFSVFTAINRIMAAENAF